MGSVPLGDPLAKIKQKFHEEILALSHELTVDLPKEIAKARAHGDLKENAEYKYAKQRQRQVRGRLRFLRRRMGVALARGRDVDEARQRARTAAGKVRPVATQD